MNPYQTLRQIRKRLLAQTWADSPGEYVFGQASDGVGGAVRIAEALPADAFRELRFPFALLRLGDFSTDEDLPALQTQTIEVTLVHAVQGDPFAERALVGGPRSAAGRGSSRSRGLLEVEERLLAAIEEVHASGAIQIYLAASTAGAPEALDSTTTVVSRRYTLEALCTRQPHYDAPSHLVLTPSGGGVVTASWINPPDRYDRIRIVLRRGTGTTPPQGPTLGTGVTLGSDFAQGVVDVPGAGTHSYSVWCGYAEQGIAPEVWSDLVRGSYRTVIAT